jgi:membrane protein
MLGGFPAGINAVVRGRQPLACFAKTGPRIKKSEESLVKMTASTVSFFKKAWETIRDAVAKWSDDKASVQGAAIAYYTLFALAPFVIIIIFIVGLAFGEDAARGRIFEQIQGLVGEKGAKAIEEMIAASHQESGGLVATMLGLAGLILGAAGLFVQLQDTLNTIWKVKPRPGRGLWTWARSRLLSIFAVVGIGFLLLVSLVASAAIQAMTGWLTAFLPPSTVLEIANFIFSFALTTALFALIYKVLPDVRLRWRDAAVGALITAFLFTIGKYLVGLYLGHSTIGSTFGAAGTLVIVLLWIYYATQIFLLGAEFTQIFANRYGSSMQPKSGAVPLTEGGPGAPGREPETK